MNTIHASPHVSWESRIGLLVYEELSRLHQIRIMQRQLESVYEEALLDFHSRLDEVAIMLGDDELPDLYTLFEIMDEDQYEVEFDEQPISSMAPEVTKAREEGTCVICMENICRDDTIRTFPCTFIS